MKNWNIWFFLAIIAVLYYNNIQTDKLVSNYESVKSISLESIALSRAIGDKIQYDKKQESLYYKLEKNRKVLDGTGCVNCHARPELALPLHRISVSDAMAIVRKGNERSIAGGMPFYSDRATRDRNSITDADLRVRLDILYSREMIEMLPPVDIPKSDDPVTVSRQ